MAIEFNCPYCNELHRLKNEYGGKRALCKNPSCRQVVVIPKPVTVPDDKPPRTAADLEAAALSALADEPAPQQAAAPPEPVIAMTCSFCEHPWTEPLSKAGKNTLCPNPECRQRQKVPEPKTDQPVDWRQTKTKLPSGAKQNFEKLEGVEDAAQAKMVSGEALRKADATGIEIEPRTLREKAIIGLSVAGLLLAITCGVWYLTRSRAEINDRQLLVDGRAEYDQASKDLDPEEAVLGSTLLNAAWGEFELRHNTDQSLIEAHSRFATARGDLAKQPSGVERSVVVAELAADVISLGGSEQQVAAQVRFSWVPDITGGKLKINKKSRTVYDELRQALQLLQPVDPGSGGGAYDFRLAIGRRLARDLAKAGQSSLAVEVIPLSLFEQAESNEAKAAIVLELYRIEPSSDTVRRAAEEFKTPGAVAVARTPFVQTLHAVILGDKKQAPTVRPSGIVLEGDRAVVAISLLEGNPDEAVKLALRHPTLETKLRSLTLCAEWSASPAAALEEARKVIESAKGMRDVAFSQYHLLKLSQAAAASSGIEQAKFFASAIADPGLRAWALGDAVHLRLAVHPKEDKVDETALDLPEDAKTLKVGHFWGLCWLERHRAAISGDRSKERKTVSTWPAAGRPFGLAGIVLGLQDR